MKTAPSCNIATPEETREYRRRCFWQRCNNTARLVDWTGHRHCFAHWWLVFKSKDSYKWFYFKTTKLYRPKRILFDITICNRCFRAPAKYTIGEGGRKEGFCEDCLKPYLPKES